MPDDIRINGTEDDNDHRRVGVATTTSRDATVMTPSFGGSEGDTLRGGTGDDVLDGGDWR